MNLEQKIEAILFWKGESMSKKKLTDALHVDIDLLNTALDNLKENLKNRGVVLLEHDESVALGTAPELSDMIENLQKEELNKDLSKAALETLSVVLYKNGASRGEIDYIRGVNSSFSLRALSVRGLVEKVLDPKDNRRYVYKPSMELLSYMGVKSVEELPDFEEVSKMTNEAAKNLEEEIKAENSEN